MSVVVVGGGLAGLFVAIELIEAGVDDLKVVEKSDAPGGVVQTITRDGFTLEPAVGALALPHPHLSPILERIGAELVPAAVDASQRQVYAGGRLVHVPASPAALLAPLVSWPAKLRAFVEPLVPSRDVADETLAAFCRRRFGRHGGEMIAWLMASGVYAGDPDRLSVRAAFPTLWGLEKEMGSVLGGAVAKRRRRHPDASRPSLHYPRSGMSSLARLAAEWLGDRYQGGFEVEEIRREGDGWIVAGDEELRADCVILAIGPREAAAVVDDELGSHLHASTSARVAVVGFGGPGDDVLPRGFGALIGPGEDMLTRGLLYESSYAPGRAPEGSWLLKVIANGPASHHGADDIADVVRAEAERVLNRDLTPAFTVVVDDLAGIPQYEIGHTRWIERLESLLAQRSGLFVTGWGYRGVGVAQLASEAVRIGETVARG